MGFFDAIWHLLNLLAPAVGLGLVAASLAKLLWHQELRGLRWWRLARALMLASGLAMLLGWAIWGRDGRMGSYAAMVAACASTLWWLGLRGGRKN